MIGWASTSSGQQPNAQTLTATTSPNYFAYAGQALKVGTAITVVLGILKAITEWTASGRKNRAIEKATRLATFVDAVTKMTPAGVTSGVLENAQREFIQAAGRCYRPKALPSKTRRAFLVYLPPRLGAYIPHFFFFSLCALAAFGIGSDVLDKTADADDLFAFGAMGVLICFMQQWAALEWRKSEGIILPLRHLNNRIDWYPANTFLGLLSNFFFIVYFIELLLAFTATPSLYQSGYSVWPLWQRVVLAIVGCPLTAVAYLWSRAEYLHSLGEIKPLSLCDMIHRAARSKTPESVIGLLVFFLLTIWCLILLLDLTFVQRIASFPDGSVGTVGSAGGSAATVTVLFLYGVIPWIAVYRRLSDLLDHGHTTTREVKCDGD